MKLTETRPSRAECMMDTAQIWAMRGTCNRAYVGAVIEKEGRILVQGYNGAPAGLPHCQHSDLSEPCLRAVHAEANAIAYAAKVGVALKFAHLYSTHMPCPNCSMLIINAGITHVTYDKDYRDASGIVMMNAAGIFVYKYEL